jgi:alpha-glucosidase (family GH31 glycosyl hydrolase)
MHPPRRVTRYAAHGLPLHTVVLDYDWHTHNPQDLPMCFPDGGFTWNNNLFSDPMSFASFLHSNATPQGHPLALALNLHPQYGVDRCQSMYEDFAAAIGRSAASREHLPLVCAISNHSWTTAFFDIVLDRNVDLWWTDMCCGGVGCGLDVKPQLWSNLVCVCSIHSLRVASVSNHFCPPLCTHSRMETLCLTVYLALKLRSCLQTATRAHEYSHTKSLHTHSNPMCMNNTQPTRGSLMCLAL